MPELAEGSPLPEQLRGSRVKDAIRDIVASLPEEAMSVDILKSMRDRLLIDASGWYALLNVLVRSSVKPYLRCVPPEKIQALRDAVEAQCEDAVKDERGREGRELQTIAARRLIEIEDAATAPESE